MRPAAKNTLTRSPSGAAILLFSGGFDSTLVLAWARRRRMLVRTLEFDYPSRPAGERIAANQIARHYGILERRRIHLPLASRAGRRTPEGYLATRNLVFHALAQSVAESSRARWVLAGHRSADADDFPDAQPSYLATIAALAARGRPQGSPIPIRNPLLKLREGQEAAWARRLAVPVRLTWSCWRTGRRPCGECQKCVERATWEASLR